MSKLKSFLTRVFLRVRIIKTVLAGGLTTSVLVCKIYDFCEVYSGITLYPYEEQFAKRIIRAVITSDGHEITALFARQSGKTETISTVVGGMMILLPTLANMPMFADDPRLTIFKDGFWVGVFAPSQRQAQITFGRMKTRIQSKLADEILKELELYFSTSNGQTVALSNGSFATAISASDNSSIEGESFKLIICEECQDISNYKIRKSIHPMGAAYNAPIVKIGTATMYKGDFYDAIARNKVRDKEYSGHVRNHFEYDYTVAAKYNPKYAKFVEKEKLRLGENSDEFRMSYKLEWILERGSLVDISEFEANNVDKFLEAVPLDKFANHVLGIDVGGKGDSTVLTFCEVDWSMPVIAESSYDEETGEEIAYQAYNSYVKCWIEIKNVPDYEEQYYLILEAVNYFKVSRIVIDATREASLAHRLKANLTIEVIPYIFSAKAKSELYKNLIKEVDSGRAKVCGGEVTRQTHEYKEFIRQVGDLQKGYSGVNLVVSHPDVSGAHDDYPDSWALAVYGCSFYGDTTIATSHNNTIKAKTQVEKLFVTKRNSITSKRR